ncbi:hypothetical protein [Solibacillus sp. NPDC093137]|uniref:hypothetical protein n=1 Tax=Solibacillus sp. NPDC093137 TaxID=3390678 RepID=UPI003CFCFFF0
MENEEIVETKVSLSDAVNLLKDRMKKDKDFNKSIAAVVSYFGTKFVSYFNSDDDRAVATEIIEDVIFAQITHGYWLMKNELEIDKDVADSDKIFPKDFWNMTENIMRNGTGPNMQALYGDEWFRSPGTQSVALRVLNQLPHGFDHYSLVLEQTAIFGSYIALRYEGEYDAEKFEKEKESAQPMVFASPYDIHFITPEVFIQFDMYSSEFESWNIFLSATSKQVEKWIGTAQLISIPLGAEKFQYTLMVSIENVLKEYEKSLICKELISRMPKQMQNDVQFRFYPLERTPEIYDAKKFLAY